MIEVTYIDSMGDDLATVNAARVSFNKWSEWEDCTSGLCLSHRDVKLIKYLGDHGHDSPMNHSSLSVHVRAPVFVARQLVKHEYLVMNEISRRYVDDEPDLFTPKTWRRRAVDKKQGSGEDIEESLNDMVDDGVFEFYNHALDLYEFMIDKGVSPEQSRMVLPQAMMTEWYWTGLLSSWAKMVNLRIQEDAQYESRVVAQQVDVIASDLWPHSWAALRRMSL